ncbi:MAG: hypothetical protein RIT44_661 [Pseudomonadota bacterium]
MVMPMSERANPAWTWSRAWAHAGEVSQWGVTLLAWLWLGEQGMRWGWGVASGVLAVVVWWTARLAVRGSAWAMQAEPLRVAVCGLLCAAGVWLPDALTRWGASHLGLLCLAAVWGVWSGALETRSRVSTFQLSKFAWHPLLAGTGVGLIWGLPKMSAAPLWAVTLGLALAALLLAARDRWSAEPVPVCAGPRGRVSVLLAPSAMGLMMGSLWLGNVWCAGLGWRTDTLVWVHLALMAGAPAVVAWTSLGARQGQTEAMAALHQLPSPLPSTRRSMLGLVLLTLGALMLFGDTPMQGLLAMLLPSLAWALHCARPRNGRDDLRWMPPWLTRTTACLLGPGLLLWVGALSPVVGPAAMQMAMGLLGALAAAQLLLQWRRPVLLARWSPQ